MGNRTDIGWKYGTYVNGDAREVKCSFCEKVISSDARKVKWCYGTLEGLIFWRN